MYRYHEKRFSRGNAMSRPPIRIGRKKLPKIVGMPGMTTRKIMMIPWSVNVALYCWALKIAPGMMRLDLMSSPRVTPTEKKIRSAKRYWTPIRLWSVDRSHETTPI